MKLRGLKWTKVKLEDWNDIWKNLESQFYILTFNFYSYQKLYSSLCCMADKNLNLISPALVVSKRKFYLCTHECVNFIQHLTKIV